MACIGVNFPNCSASYTTIQPDPDIDGIGVLISFIVSAALTLVVSVVAIWVDCCPEKEPHMNLLPTSKSAGSTRPYDNWLYPTISSDKKHYWMAIMERFILGLADQQLVTGTAVLLVGYLKCDITAYHFTIVGDLAWFSSNVHITSLKVLCYYFQEHHAARTWRIALMVAMCAMLIASTVFEFNGRWYQSLPVPAHCVFVLAYSVSDIGFLTFTLLLVLSGYITAIASMFSTSFYPGVIEKKYVQFWQSTNKRYLELRKVPWIDLNLIQKIKEICLRIILADKTFLGSLFDVLWFVFGIIWLLSDRVSGAEMMDESSTSTQSWGFGQLVPMFLLFLPIVTVLEIFWEEKKKCETKEFQARKDAIKKSRERRQERIEQRRLRARSDARNEVNQSQGVSVAIATTSAGNIQALSSSTRSNSTDLNRPNLDTIAELHYHPTITSAQTNLEMRRQFEPPRQRRSWRTYSLTSPSDGREAINAGQNEQ